MLQELYKYHKELVKMASVFSKQDAEDIVQETYIKLHLYSSYDKCFTNDILNKSYIFICIRSVFIRQFLKKDNYESFYNEGDVDEKYLIVDEFNEDEEIDWYKFRTKCEAEVNSWDAYDKKLFTIYRDSGMSMQELSNETKISKTSIFHSLKEHKRKLKDLFQNDYNNLK
jgi:DNA-directed RNA polymerase specialized sigma24 family protein